MQSFIRKAIFCFSAVFAFVFVSCADKESKDSTLYLNDTYSYILCGADSDCADAEADFPQFEKLKDLSYRNLEKLAGRDGSYMWIKSEFTLPDELKGKTLGYVIPYLHFAEKVWLNGIYLGGYGQFPPELISLTQQLPTCTMTLKPSGAAFIHASASIIRSSDVSI